MLNLSGPWIKEAVLQARRGLRPRNGLFGRYVPALHGPLPGIQVLRERRDGLRNHFQHVWLQNEKGMDLFSILKLGGLFGFCCFFWKIIPAECRWRRISKFLITFWKKSAPRSPASWENEKSKRTFSCLSGFSLSFRGHSTSTLSGSHFSL